MRNILNDITTRQYKRVYLLYGEETYLINQYKNKLIKGICGDDTMNLSRFEGKKIDLKEVMGICETLPFFTDFRCVLIENSGFLKNSNEELAEYLDNIPDTTTIIFVEREVDKRSKVYKRVKEKGYVCEMKTQTLDTLKKWIIGILNENNKKIKESTLNLFIDTVGNDMENIYSELEKLICYCIDKDVIEPEDILNVSTPVLAPRIFELIDALGYKNQKKALEIYYDLIIHEEAPEMILFMLCRQFNIMIQLYECKKLGMSNKQMIEKTGLAPFVITKSLKQIDNFAYSTMKKALEEGIELTARTRTDGINKNIAVELMIIKYSQMN